MTFDFIAFITSDKFFGISSFSTLTCYGMFWGIPGSLIYEIKANINEDMKVFGYLMMVMRIGKFIGHIIIIKLTVSVKPKYYPEIHLTSMAVKFIGIILTPFCSSWISLAINWFLIGISLGSIESILTFINTAVNGKSAPKYTNVYYFCFSVGAALTPLVVNGTKKHIDNPRKELAIVCCVVGAVSFVLNMTMLTSLLLRRKRGIFLGETEATHMVAEASDVVVDSFKKPIISGSCLAMTSFFFMCARTILEVFLLPFAQKAQAGLTERDSYSVLQAVSISSMVVRFGLVFFAFYFTKTSIILACCNLNLVLGLISLLSFKDNSLEGIMFSMILFGMVMGSFQNSLVNWMADRMTLNPTNTAPFFIATAVGSTLTPAVTPYLIKNNDGTINLDTYQLLVFLLFVLAAVFCGAMMLSEWLAVTKIGIMGNSSFVEVIKIVPETAGNDAASDNGDNDDVSIPNHNPSKMTVVSSDTYIRPRTTMSSFGHHRHTPIF